MSNEEKFRKYAEGKTFMINKVAAFVSVIVTVLIFVMVQFYYVGAWKATVDEKIIVLENNQTKETQTIEILNKTIYRIEYNLQKLCQKSKIDYEWVPN